MGETFPRDGAHETRAACFPRRVKRIVLIVNPFASRVTPELADSVAETLSAAGTVERQETSHAGAATELAAVASGACDAIVVFSGDGGFNEVLNGLAAETPVGFVPGGGTSVLPRALGIPRDPLRAAHRLARALAEERTRRISVGRANGRRFGFSAGVGLDAEVVRRVDALGRSREGVRAGDFVFAWTLARFLAERRFRLPPAVEISGLGRAAFALVANGDPYTYAGPLPLHVAPAARFEDGLDLFAPTRVTPARIPALLARVVTGRSALARGFVLAARDRDSLHIRCDQPLPLQVDGEDLGDVADVELTSERHAVQVLV